MLIEQRSGTDCAICSIAMATGRTYEEVMEKVVPDLYDPTYTEPGHPKGGFRDTEEALERLGYSNRFENGQNVGDFSCWYRGFYISPEFFRTMAWGRRALMSVPSLNNETGLHMVYWDGISVFDPSRKKRYTEFSQLKPEYMTVFREGVR